MNLNNIGKTIRKLRQQANISQMDIEKRDGMSRFVISKIENSHVIPTIETLVRIGNALDIPAYEILRIAMESRS